MWISLDDIDTLELTYIASQLSHMTRPHMHATATIAVLRRLRGVQMGWGMLRWATFLRKLKPGRTFFQIWVVCQCNVGQARMSRGTNCWRSAMSRHQRRQASSGKWPTFQSGSVCSHSGPPARWDHRHPVTDLPHIVPEGQRLYTHIPRIPDAQSRSHNLAPAGQDWERGLGEFRSVCEPLTRWPHDLCSTSLTLSFNSYRPVSSSKT